MTNKRKVLIMRKDALKRMKDRHEKESIPSIVLSNGALLQTSDYDKEELFLPCVDENGQLPCWDWFRMTNAKRDRMYYVDFSFPYIYLNDKEVLSLEFSYLKYPLTTAGFFRENFRDKFYTWKEKDIDTRKARDEYQKYILKNYDFTKTFEKANEIIEEKKKYDKLIVSISRDPDTKLFDGFSIVAPYCMKDKTVVEIFEMALERIKVGNLDKEELAQKMISEIEYEFFPEDLK
jgi:hypothetical protein